MSDVSVVDAPIRKRKIKWGYVGAAALVCIPTIGYLGCTGFQAWRSYTQRIEQTRQILDENAEGIFICERNDGSKYSVSAIMARQLSRLVREAKCLPVLVAR